MIPDNKMVTKTFSIATPTRNSLDKLKRCIGSVRGQQGAAYEHLIQDAKSTDGTPLWLQTQSGLDAISEPDGGMYDAINRAWSRSNGDFFSWLNSDEQYLPGTLKKVADYFSKNPAVDVVFGNYIVADSSGKPIALRREIPFKQLYVVNSFLNMQSATIFYRRHLWDSGILKLDSKYRYSSDMDLILRIAKNGFKIGHINDYLSVFGIDGTNLSTHPEVQKETEMIRLHFGASKLQWVRKILLTGRSVERLLCGGYRRSAIRYQYATNEAPSYTTMVSSRLGGRYSLADIEGQVDATSPVESK